MWSEKYRWVRFLWKCEEASWYQWAVLYLLSAQRASAKSGSGSRISDRTRCWYRGSLIAVRERRTGQQWYLWSTGLVGVDKEWLQRKLRASKSCFSVRSPIEYVKMEKKILEILKETCYRDINVVNMPWNEGRGFWLLAGTTTSQAFLREKTVERMKMCTKLT